MQFLAVVSLLLDLASLGLYLHNYNAIAIGAMIAGFDVVVILLEEYGLFT